MESNINNPREQGEALVAAENENMARRFSWKRFIVGFCSGFVAGSSVAFASVTRLSIKAPLFDPLSSFLKVIEPSSLTKFVLKNPVISLGTGMPRGLGVSATMSELYMKYFDLTIRRVEGVYYYARFVDDIIVFCSSKRSKDMVWDTVQSELKNLGLNLNEEKSYVWSPSSYGVELVYLGYTLRKKGNKVDVSIADKKIKVIKTRLTKSFVRFSKDHNFDLLKMRIKFLTGNFTLYQADTLLPIKVGIFFNYRQATNTDSLNEMDKYYQRLLHCRSGKLGSHISLTKQELKDLEKYSFRFGFDNHVNHHFTNEQMGMIKNCWL